VVFDGRHADVLITAEMGAALGRMIAREGLVCVVDLSELGSNAARRRFRAAVSETLYEANEEPLHLVLDEADLWAPQRPFARSDRPPWSHRRNRPPRTCARLHPVADHATAGRGAQGCRRAYPKCWALLLPRASATWDADELASALGKKPSGGHWNSGIAVLRNNGLIETDGRGYREAVLFRK
jgi:hypothetical protein